MEIDGVVVDVKKEKNTHKKMHEFSRSSVACITNMKTSSNGWKQAFYEKLELNIGIKIHNSVLIHMYIFNSSQKQFLNIAESRLIHYTPDNFNENSVLIEYSNLNA